MQHAVNVNATFYFINLCCCVRLVLRSLLLCCGPMLTAIHLTVRLAAYSSFLFCLCTYFLPVSLTVFAKSHFSLELLKFPYSQWPFRNFAFLSTLLSCIEILIFRFLLFSVYCSLCSIGSGIFCNVWSIFVTENSWYLSVTRVIVQSSVIRWDSSTLQCSSVSQSFIPASFDTTDVLFYPETFSRSSFGEGIQSRH